MATRCAHCSWDVDHARSVVTLHSPVEQDFYGRMLEEASAWCQVWLMLPALGIGPFLVRNQESPLTERGSNDNERLRVSHEGTSRPRPGVIAADECGAAGRVTGRVPPFGTPVPAWFADHSVLWILHCRRALASRGVVRDGDVPLSRRPPSHSRRCS